MWVRPPLRALFSEEAEKRTRGALKLACEEIIYAEHPKSFRDKKFAGALTHDDPQKLQGHRRCVCTNRTSGSVLCPAHSQQVYNLSREERDAIASLNKVGIR